MAQMGDERARGAEQGLDAEEAGLLRVDPVRALVRAEDSGWGGRCDFARQTVSSTVASGPQKEYLAPPHLDKSRAHSALALPGR